MIDLSRKYDPILQSILHEYGRHKVLILKVEILVKESNQTNMKMMEKVSASTSPRYIWGSGGLPPEQFSKTTPSRMPEIAILLSGNHVFITDFRPGMENMILHSNLYCTNFTKTQKFDL